MVKTSPDIPGILHRPLPFHHAVETLGNVLRLRTVVALQHLQILVSGLSSKGQKVQPRNARLRIGTCRPRRKRRARVVEIQSFSDDTPLGVEFRTKPCPISNLSPQRVSRFVTQGPENLRSVPQFANEIDDSQSLGTQSHIAPAVRFRHLVRQMNHSPVNPRLFNPEDFPRSHPRLTSKQKSGNYQLHSRCRDRVSIPSTGDQQFFDVLVGRDSLTMFWRPINGDGK